MKKSSISLQRILLADNQALTSAGIQHLLLESKRFEIIKVTSKEDLLHEATTPPSLMIIDYERTKNFTAEQMLSLTKAFEGIPILVITADQDKATILGVLETGVNGFLFKDCGEEEIVRAVDALLQGQKFYCNRVFDILMESRQQLTAEDCLPTELTSREIEIIKLVVKAKSTAEIADMLNLSPHTISTHRKNITRKLKISSPVELVTYAYDLGLMNPAD